MSVRIMSVGPGPFFRIATMPKPPTLVVTSYPNLRMRSASFAEVFSSCSESSGFLCRSM